MAEHPLEVIRRIDPKFFENVNNSKEFALSDGALPRKFKLLIAMALDASHGVADGTGSLARQAMGAGATKEEVVEALRVVHYISGAIGAHTAARGIKELF